MARAIRRCAAAMMVVAVATTATSAWLTRRSGAVKPVPSDSPYLDLPVSWTATVGAVLVFGSFALMLKLPSFMAGQVDFVAVQCWIGVGASLGSLLVATFEPFQFTWWAVLGSALWAVANCFAVLAIQQVGYAVGVAIWGGGSICVSFLWGALYFDQPVKSAPGSVLALGVLLVGITLAALAQSAVPNMIASTLCSARRRRRSPTSAVGNRAARPTSQQVYQSGYRAPAPSMEDPSEVDEGAAALVHAVGDECEYGSLENAPRVQSRFQKRRPLLGIGAALIVALINGAVEVPFTKYQNENPRVSAIGYITSFGIGLLMATPAIWAVYSLVIRCGRPPDLQVKVAAIPGIVTGLMFAMGNILATWATEYLGDTIGFPITQCALLVTAVWGVLLFKEVTGLVAILILAVACVVIIGGAALLSIFG